MERWARLATWDGILPMAVAAAPFTVRALFPRNDILQLMAAVLVPMFAALLRGMIGERQIRNQCNGELPVWRQVALAVAIVWQLLFEAFVAVLTFADDEPLWAWGYPILFYTGYLLFIVVAFFPRRCRPLSANTQPEQNTKRYSPGASS